MALTPRPVTIRRRRHREPVTGSGTPVANVYLGTSEFAASVLRSLAATSHRPALVVAPPDRKRGRGRRVGSPPTAEVARELGIELHQTPSVNEPDSRRALLERDPQVAIVCAFGQLIGEPLLSELEMLNIHPSLLPRWRGAAPIERAIMAGDEHTGVCVMRLTAGLDSGPVALREQMEIGAGEDYGSLAARLAELSGALIVEALDRRAAANLDFEEQPEAGVSYAEKIEAADRRVDPLGPAKREELRIRALSPHIGAFVELDVVGRLGVRAAEATTAEPPVIAAGEFAAGEDDRLLLGCADGALRIGEVQPAGGRWMDAADYLRGRGLPTAAAQVGP